MIKYVYPCVKQISRNIARGVSSHTCKREQFFAKQRDTRDELSKQTNIYVFVHTHVGHTCVHEYTHTRKHMYILCMYAPMYVIAFIHVDMCARSVERTHIHVRKYMYVHIHVVLPHRS